ncbi:MAG: 2-oxoacid:acceptor oxidoreductase family protein [Candidatus Norongarragalinales archaeon]
MKKVIEIRFHGRGGQGVVTSGELLASAAFFDGKNAQSFPTFGPERSGAPVKAFCRIDDKPIRLHEAIHAPDYILVLDETLADAAFESGTKQGTVAIIASKQAASDFKAPTGVRVLTVDAYAIARELLGAPFVNTIILGAFAKASGGLVTLASIEKALKHRFNEQVAAKNFAAVRKCFDSLDA